MTHASVFSGIGGPEVAATMLGWENLFHCEINPFGRKVLDYWYPNSKSYEDITTTDFTEWCGRVDVLTGGFPCQPFSYAGRRRGAEDDRYLWPSMYRAIDEIQPTWVVAENVAGILTMVEQGEVSKVAGTASLFDAFDDLRGRYELRETFTLQRICSDLESHGYAVQPVLVPACAVGAPHRRDRVFIVARRREDTDGQRTIRDTESRHRQSDEFGKQGTGSESPQVRQFGGADSVSVAERTSAPADTRREGLEGMHDPRSSESEHGDGIRRDSTRCSGTSIRRTPSVTEGECGQRMRLEQSEDSISRSRVLGGTNLADDCGGHSADTSSERLEGSRGQRLQESQGGFDREAYIARFIGDTRSGRPDYCGERWQHFPSVSPVHRGNDGLPFDVDRLTISFGKWRTEALKAYGNAIVPQVMYEIFRAIEIVEQREQTKARFQYAERETTDDKPSAIMLA